MLLPLYQQRKEIEIQSQDENNAKGYSLTQPHPPPFLCHHAIEYNQDHTQRAFVSLYSLQYTYTLPSYPMIAFNLIIITIIIILIIVNMIIIESLSPSVVPISDFRRGFCRPLCFYC